MDPMWEEGNPRTVGQGRGGELASAQPRSRRASDEMPGRQRAWLRHGTPPLCPGAYCPTQRSPRLLAVRKGHCTESAAQRRSGT